MSKEKTNEPNYNIFAVTFHGHYLDPIRNQFIARGVSGVRRRVITIDMDKERSLYNEAEKLKAEAPSKEKPAIPKTGAGDGIEVGKNETAETKPGEMHPDVTLAIAAIGRERKLNTEYTARLVKDRQFNLIDYWSDSLRPGPPGRSRGSVVGRRSVDKGGKKNRLSAINESPDGVKIVCTKLKPQRHNIVGRPESLAKTRFIEDDPESTKLFVILVGYFDNEFYVDLLRRYEPLRAIFHFFPDEPPYEMLVPNRERREFVVQALENVDESIYGLRTDPCMKTTGVFRHFIPFISSCRAEVYSGKIFDQLTWAFYDIEASFQHYMTYYVKPFHEIDVGIPSDVEFLDSYRYASQLYLQGNYLLCPTPGVAADTASILLYVDMLFSTIDTSDSILTEWEMVLLSTPLPRRLYLLYKDSVNTLAERYADAFFSITKVKKVDRLFLEENNRALNELVRYVDHGRFRHIYLTCLEYKIQRKYLSSSLDRPEYQTPPTTDFPGPMILPPFVKLYTTNDGISQRLVELMGEYDQVEVTRQRPEYSLYTFQRTLHEVTECNRMYVVPSRLCFRDFTLFMMDDFVRALITPEVRENQANTNLTELERFEKLMRQHSDEYNPDMFIRPRSLKAQQTQTVSKLLNFKASKRQSRKDSAREREMQMAEEAFEEMTSSDDGIGLPRNHHLLSGYNLEDIRQEIWVKNSKYFFEEGSVQLYEERLCFTDTNKLLKMKVDGSEFVIGTPVGNILAVKPQLRLTTKNDITVRMYEQPMECASIVMNYPNGLSVYYQESHIEQLWTRPDSPSNEQRRRMTPFGAVIIEYKSEDLIVVLRYNGEVYRLYQYEFVFGEGEDEDSSLPSDRSFDRTTSGSANLKLLMNSVQNESSQQEPRELRHRIPKEAHLSRQVTTSAKRRNSKRSLKQDSISMESTFTSNSGVSGSENERECVANEMEFLKKLSKIYELSYKHLIVTTSIGRIFNFTLNDKCYETIRLGYDDWHDYFANESYAMREDNVRMLWGSNYLKCFHADGTVLTTQTEDIYHSFEGEDEAGNVFSQSSSHMGVEESSVGDRLRKSHASIRLETERRFPIKKKRYKTYEPYLRTVGEAEEEMGKAHSDPGYICVNISCHYAQHDNYASIYFLPQLITYDMVYFLMEVKAFDDLTIHRTREVMQTMLFDQWQSSSLDIEQDDDQNTITTAHSGGGDAPQTYTTYTQPLYPMTASTPDLDHINSYISHKMQTHPPSPQSTTTSSRSISNLTEMQELYSSKYDEEVFHDVVKMWIGDDFYILASEEYFEIHAVLERKDLNKRSKRDKLEFRFSYMESLPDIFQKLVGRISAFKKFNDPKTEQIFFLEKTIGGSQKRGLEFMDEILERPQYARSVSNTITQFKALKSNMDRFKNQFDWYKKDIVKFPKFPEPPKKILQPVDSFPMVLSVNMFLKIPQQLRSVDKIYEFMEPLDVVNFKKTRYHMKETMSHYIHPHIAKEVHRLYSENHWRRRHEELRRQKLIEAQRIGLYHAILHHKRYPGYFLFNQKYKGKAKNIDYFEFCLLQCAEKQENTLSASQSLKKPEKSKRTQDSSKPFKVTIGTGTESRRSTAGGAQNARSMPIDLNEPLGSEQNLSSMSMHSA